VGHNGGRDYRLAYQAPGRANCVCARLLHYGALTCVLASPFLAGRFVGRAGWTDALRAASADDVERAYVAADN
jgi:hypothetical protein